MSALKLPVAIITGTNSGLGLALATKLAKTHLVYAGMRGMTASKSASLLDAAKRLGVGDNIIPTELDVDCDASVSRAIGRAVEDSARVDVLVNNAGYSQFGTLEMMTIEQAKAQFETNFFGVLRCQQAVLPTMRGQKSGKIVNISSVGGVWGQPFNDVYCASKFALEGLTESQAAMFRSFGVYVTNVQPGAITSSFIDNAQKPDTASVPEEYHRHLQSTLERYGKTKQGQSSDEVAQVVMDKVISVKKPPIKVQTNPMIQPIFDMQLKDPSGEAGVRAAHTTFFGNFAGSIHMV